MIVAVGDVDAQAVAAGAVAMASGATADHESHIRLHADGWGAVWADPEAPGGLSVLRDVRPATETLMTSGLPAVRTRFLAVHLRRAPRPSVEGPRFTHPLQRPGDAWCFMHNGSMPTVHRLLGMECSTFDSAEYFDYLVPPGARTLDAREALRRLEAVPPGDNSGNAVAVRPDRAYVIHWRAAGHRWPRYFTMQQFVGRGVRVVASEIIPSIAPADRWEPVPQSTVLELPFNP
jgi:glutamine amidotransferase